MQYVSIDYGLKCFENFKNVAVFQSVGPQQHNIKNAKESLKIWRNSDIEYNSNRISPINKFVNCLLPCSEYFAIM